MHFSMYQHSFKLHPKWHKYQTGEIQKSSSTTNSAALGGGRLESPSVVAQSVPVADVEQQLEMFFNQPFNDTQLVSGSLIKAVIYFSYIIHSAVQLPVAALFLYLLYLHVHCCELTTIFPLNGK